MARDGVRNSIVAHWIARLDEVDLADTQALEEIIARIPAGLVRRIAEEGGSRIREKLLAPTFAEWERDGRIEWTGEFSANGQKIWRKT
jgi:hypothetical protein